MSKSPWDVDIDTLVADRQAFSSFVCTPIKEVMEELKKRWRDKKLEKKISELFNSGIPLCSHKSPI